MIERRRVDPPVALLPKAGETAYGEDHPRVADDRRPIVLVVLDGLGDRPQMELVGHTPAESAITPVLDTLTKSGQCGVHVPFGPGRAPASEVAHWSMFGYADVPIAGRALLEAIGQRDDPIDVPTGAMVMYAALRPSIVHDDIVWITGRVRRDEPGTTDGSVSDLLLEPLRVFHHGDYRFTLHPLRRGEAVVVVEGPVRPVTDSDPFFEHLHPWLAPQPLDGDRSSEGAATADAVRTYLAHARQTLQAHPLNQLRTDDNLPGFDVLTTKWSSVRANVPAFTEVVGLTGAMVVTSPMYRGLGRLLGMDVIEAGADLRASLALARAAIDNGAAFVHVHTKETDEAGHTKSPTHKRDVIERLDAHLAALIGPEFADAVIAVTGDHATPSSQGVLHTGDPTPLVVRAPDLLPDDIERFGERWCATGTLGRIAAADLLPLLLSHANRPRFLGSRATTHPTLALPDWIVPMPPA